MAADALAWISTLLRDRDVPFLVCGGLAAIGYGSKRPLNDIDLFVRGADFRTVVDAGAEFITKPAQRYRGEGWDLEYVQFIYRGTKIEVGNADGARILDAAAGRWIALPVDFSRQKPTRLFGVDVPLMARADLIRYKSTLGRPVDSADIRAMSAAEPQPLP